MFWQVINTYRQALVQFVGNKINWLPLYGALTGTASIALSFYLNQKPHRERLTFSVDADFGETPILDEVGQVVDYEEDKRKIMVMLKIQNQSYFSTRITEVGLRLQNGVSFRSRFEVIAEENLPKVESRDIASVKVVITPCRIAAMLPKTTAFTSFLEGLTGVYVVSATGKRFTVRGGAIKKLAGLLQNARYQIESGGVDQVAGVQGI